MEWNLLASLMSLIGTLAGTFGGILVSQRLTNFRLERLENEVREHNNFARRMPVLEEQIRVANHRIYDLEQRVERKEGKCEREAD